MPAADSHSPPKSSREEIVENWLQKRPEEAKISVSSFGCRTSEPAINVDNSGASLKECRSETYLDKQSKDFPLTWSEYGFGDRYFDHRRQESGYASEYMGSAAANQEPLKTYYARWYVLIVFSIFALTQYCLWNTFGPISDTLKKGFHWSNSDIAMLANWDTILYVLFAMQICWIVEEKGIRNSVIGSVFCSVIGSGLRCITSDPDKAFWAMNAGQIMNGLAGTVAQAVGPVISTVWFPPGERATATAVSSLFASLGVAVSFVAGPYIVEDPLNQLTKKEEAITSKNETVHGNIMALTRNNTLAEAGAAAERYRDRVMFLLYTEFGFSFLLLLLVVAYFPNKPPTPPSNSAKEKRLNFKQGCYKVMKNKSFWLLVFIGASTTGIYSGWYALLAVNFDGFGLNVSQKEAGWIGFYSTITGIIGGIMMGRLVDICTRRMKLSLTILYCIATLCFCWIALMCLRLSEYTLGNLYQACMVGGFCVAGSIPLLYELVIETTYPVPETVSIGILTLVNNAFTFIFLLVLSIPGVSTRWMNWCLVGVCAVAVPLFVVLRDHYNRLEVDLQTIVVLPEGSTDSVNKQSNLNSLVLTDTASSNAVLQYSASTGSLYVNQSYYSTNTVDNSSAVIGNLSTVDIVPNNNDNGSQNSK